MSVPGGLFDLYPRCGYCDAKLRPVPGMRHAPTVCDRTCRRCGTKWRIIAEPLPRPPDPKVMAIHKVTLTDVSLSRG